MMVTLGLIEQDNDEARQGCTRTERFFFFNCRHTCQRTGGLVTFMILIIYSSLSKSIYYSE